MGDRVQGKVALITGAARGQGRSHARCLAAEGASIIAIDACSDIDTFDYPMSSKPDLSETVKLVRNAGGQIVPAIADVRDPVALQTAVAEGIEEFGRLDIICANAGVCSVQPWDQVTPALWQDTIDINLTGVWNTCVAGIQPLIDGGGGSIIITSSSAGVKGLPFLTPYSASKFAVVGVAKSLANELGRYSIRVNSLHPTGVDTPMCAGTDGITQCVSTAPELGPIYMNTMPVEVIDARDVSQAVVFLASDESRFVTGLAMTIDAGNTSR